MGDKDDAEQDLYVAAYSNRNTAEEDWNALKQLAADDVITGVVSGAAGDTDPRAALRQLAAGLFDAIDAHPWVGAELSRAPWRPALLDFVRKYSGPGVARQYQWTPEGELTTTQIWVYKVQ